MIAVYQLMILKSLSRIKVGHVSLAEKKIKIE